MNFHYSRPFFKARKAFFILHNTNLTTFALRNVPNLSKNRLIEWIDSSKKCIGTCIMGKFSKMNRFTVLESQNRLSTSLLRFGLGRQFRDWEVLHMFDFNFRKSKLPTPDWAWAVIHLSSPPSQIHPFETTYQRVLIRLSQPTGSHILLYLCLHSNMH